MKLVRPWALGDKVGLLICRKLVSQIKNWRWGAFAIFLTLLFGFGFIGSIVRNIYYILLERLYFSVFCLSLLALWGLGLQRRVFSRLFWRILFFVHALLFVLHLIYGTGTKHELPLLWHIIIHVTDTMIFIPYWIGLFIYAFRSKHIWEGEEHELTYIEYSRYKWDRRKRWLRHFRFPIVALVILFLTFIPIVIRKSRLCYLEGWSSEPPPGPGMILPFTKVTRFGRRAILLTPHVYSTHRDGTKPGVLGLFFIDGDRFGAPEIEQREIPHDYDLWRGFIAVKPDNSAFYVGTRTQLVEFDATFNIKRRIPISQFEFSPKEFGFEFGQVAWASNDTLWFSVRKVLNPSKSSKALLAEWILARSPSTRIIADPDAASFDAIAVDEDKREVFASTGLWWVETYDFSSQESRPLPVTGSYAFADFEKRFGLLLSKKSTNRSSERPAIVKIDPNSETEHIITEGVGAVWSFDGYVYFCDGISELWRCRADGTDRELVFMATEEPSTTIGHHYPPKVSHDRTLLAFNYTYSEQINGMLLLDLKSKEYLLLAGDNFNHNRIAWLTLDENESKSHRMQDEGESTIDKHK